jgi:coenzyme PQQ precursor peptide PqqA
MEKPEKETWTKPQFEDLRVSAECTGYAGSDDGSRP